MARKYHHTTVFCICSEKKAIIEACAQANGEKVNAMLNRLFRDAAGMTEGEWKKAYRTGRIKSRGFAQASV